MEFSTFDFRFSIWKSEIDNRQSKIDVGWPTGLEPATTRTTIWGSTIELRPPSKLPSTKFKICRSFCKYKWLAFSVCFLHSRCRARLDCNCPPVDYHCASLSNEAGRLGFTCQHLDSSGSRSGSGAARRSKRNFSQSLHDRPAGGKAGA